MSKQQTNVEFDSGRTLTADKKDPMVEVIATAQGFESNTGRLVEAGETFLVPRSLARQDGNWFRPTNGKDIELTEEETAAAQAQLRSQTGATSGGLGPNPNPEVAPAGNTSQTRTPSDKKTGDKTTYDSANDGNDTNAASAKKGNSDLA